MNSIRLISAIICGLAWYIAGCSTEQPKAQTVNTGSTPPSGASTMSSTPSANQNSANATTGTISQNAATPTTTASASTTQPATSAADITDDITAATTSLPSTTTTNTSGTGAITQGINSISQGISGISGSLGNLATSILGGLANSGSYNTILNSIFSQIGTGGQSLPSIAGLPTHSSTTQTTTTTLSQPTNGQMTTPMNMNNMISVLGNLIPQTHKNGMSLTAAGTDSLVIVEEDGTKFGDYRAIDILHDGNIAASILVPVNATAASFIIISDKFNDLKAQLPSALATLLNYHTILVNAGMNDAKAQLAALEYIDEHFAHSSIYYMSSL